MESKSQPDISSKNLIVFDLDGTLAESRSRIDEEMCALLVSLLSKRKVAVISGGAYSQFKKQLLSHLPEEGANLENLFLFPATGTSFYKFQKGKWINVYDHKLDSDEREKIINTFEVAIQKSGVSIPEKSYGDRIDDRGSQITFSALGQNAPLSVKKGWDPDMKKRNKIKKVLDELLPEFEVHLGGTTSIDVTKKGIDKAHGIRQMEKYLDVKKENMLFVGDALREGGNDYVVEQMGVDTVLVKGVEDTKKVVTSLL